MGLCPADACQRRVSDKRVRQRPPRSRVPLGSGVLPEGLVVLASDDQDGLGRLKVLWDIRDIKCSPRVHLFVPCNNGPRLRGRSTIEK